MTRDMHLLKKDGCLFLWLNNKHLKVGAVDSRRSRRPETGKTTKVGWFFTGNSRYQMQKSFSARVLEQNLGEFVRKTTEN